MHDVDCVLQRIVVKEGNLTIHTAGVQQELLLELIVLAREVEIDLGDVREVDAAGIRLLIRTQGEAERRCRSLFLSNANEAVTGTLERSGLGHLL